MTRAMRRAVYAGSWYPASRKECESQIGEFMAGAPPGGEARRGGIVPHAGWYYSGRIACRVVARLAAGTPPDVLAIFGMHLRPGDSPHLMSAGAWETPLGPLRVDEELAAAIAGRFPCRIETAGRFVPDNTIELQLPFVRHFLPQVSILALGVPPAPAAIEIGCAVVEAAAGLGRRLKVLGSTDLTHYGPSYGLLSHGSGPEALDWVRRSNDRRMIEAILALDSRQVLQEAHANANACCAGAVAAALSAAAAMGAETGETVAYATSHDRTPAESFVGYVGVVF
jgi:hypothetical protein